MPVQKRWTVLGLVGGAIVTAIVFFAGGEPDTVEIDGSTFTLAQVTQTIVAGPDLATIPTPNPNSRDICYIHGVGDGSRSQKTVITIKPADSYWTPTERGTPTAGTNVEFRVVTLDLTSDEAVSVRSSIWRVVLTDMIPSGVEIIP